MPVEWNDERVVAAVERGCERGVAKGSLILQEAIRAKLSRIGAFKSFGTQATQEDRDFVAKNGLVDPPGGSPRLRTGTLRRAIQTAKISRFRREVGLQGGLEYGPIHEFGGPIDHPGGTPYIVVTDRATGQPRAVFLRKASSINPSAKRRRKAKQQAGSDGFAEMIAKGVQVKFTKPHRINMPARPFIRPARKESESAVMAAITGEIEKALGGGN